MAICVAPIIIANTNDVLQAQNGVSPTDAACVAIILSKNEYGATQAWTLSIADAQTLAQAALPLLAMAVVGRAILGMLRPTK